jgi:EmrB/QacA subfamily drug resistance transporter
MLLSPAGPQFRAVHLLAGSPGIPGGDDRVILVYDDCPEVAPEAGALVRTSQRQVKEVLMPVGPHYHTLYRAILISHLIQAASLRRARHMPRHNFLWPGQFRVRKKWIMLYSSGEIFLLRKMVQKGKTGFEWGVLTIVCLAVFIMVIDTTIMNVSITALVEELNTTLPTIQAIIAIYALIMASFMLIGGKLQDVLGRKRAFLFGIALYGIGTLTASISWNATVLLVGWSILEGLGAVFMMPATTTFITSAYQGRDRAFAFGMWGGIGAAGAAFGPIIGGYLTTYFSWRWAFRLELLVVVLILLFSHLLSDSRPVFKWRDMDIIGTILSFAGLGAIVIGILLMRNRAAWDYLLVIIGLGIVLMGIFYIWQKRRTVKGKIPLVDVAIFKNRAFVLGNAVGTIQGIVIAGFLFIIPVFLQNVTGATAFETGLALLPMSVVVFVVSIGATRFSTYVSPKYIMLAGIGISLAGSVMLRDVFYLSTTIPDIILPSVVFGTGIGLILSQVSNLTLSAVPAEQSTDAAGVLNTFRQLGTSLGTALIGVILLIFILSGLFSGVTQANPGYTLENEAIASGLQAWIDKMETIEIPVQLPPELVEKITLIVDSAISNGMKRSFDAISLMLCIAFAAALFIPAHEGNAEDKKHK